MTDFAKEARIECVAIRLSVMDDDERPLPSAWAGRMADYYRMLARAAIIADEPAFIAERAAGLAEGLAIARPIDEWHEDFGDALWWKFPITEAPYSGSPLDTKWPGYHTHWTRFRLPADPVEAILSASPPDLKEE